MRHKTIIMTIMLSHTGDEKTLITVLQKHNHKKIVIYKTNKQTNKNILLK